MLPHRRSRTAAARVTCLRSGVCERRMEAQNARAGLCGEQCRPFRARAIFIQKPKPPLRFGLGFRLSRLWRSRRREVFGGGVVHLDARRCGVVESRTTKDAGTAPSALAQFSIGNPGLRFAVAWALDFCAFGAVQAIKCRWITTRFAATWTLDFCGFGVVQTIKCRWITIDRRCAYLSPSAPKARKSKAQADRGPTGRGEAWVSVKERREP